MDAISFLGKLWEKVWRIAAQSVISINVEIIIMRLHG